MSSRLPPRPFRIALFAACVAVVLWFSLAPPDSLPGIENFWDKAEHASAYMALTLVGLALFGASIPLVAGIWLLGVAVEFLQAAMPFDRMGDWRDAVANTVGVLAGLAVAWAARRLRAA